MLSKSNTFFQENHITNTRRPLFSASRYIHIVCTHHIIHLLTADVGVPKPYNHGSHLGMRIKRRTRYIAKPGSVECAEINKRQNFFLSLRGCFYSHQNSKKKKAFQHRYQSYYHGDDRYRPNPFEVMI
jgi:hypothetical protein